MGEATYEDLMKAFSDVIQERNIRENEMTTRMLAGAAGVSVRYATYVLQSLVESGVLTKRENVLHDNHSCNAYSPAEGKTWEDAIKAISGG